MELWTATNETLLLTDEDAARVSSLKIVRKVSVDELAARVRHLSSKPFNFSVLVVVLIMRLNGMQSTIYHFSCSRTIFVNALQISDAFLYTVLNIQLILASVKFATAFSNLCILHYCQKSLNSNVSLKHPDTNTTHSLT